jgi:UDP-N-acetyl-D-mannosaminuronic acid dehydrogenase
VPGAGLAAGPCLYKDTLQLSSLFFGNFAVGNAAIQTNERLADYLSNKALKNSSTKKIVILGAAFKANCDDFRSSLSFKILKNLKRQSNKKILLVDPYVNHPKVMQKINFDFKNCYFILATPHKSFEKIIKKIPKKSFLNVWND